MTQAVNQTAAPAVNTEKAADKKFEREELIKFLADNLYNVLQYKMTIYNEFLRGCHLRAKALGDDLFFLTVSYYKQKGLSCWKHNMSDFITPKAKELIESGERLGGKLIFEHLVPKKFYFAELNNALKTGKLTQELVFETLNKYYYTCTVTIKEDERLNETELPEGWHFEDTFYRYKKAGIIFEDNLHNFKAKDKE